MSLFRIDVLKCTSLPLRHPPSQLVPLHSTGHYDCDPVGGRLQRANQTAATDLAGCCQRGRQRAEGTAGAQDRLHLRLDAILILLFSPQNIHVCLGSLFVPEAYITATRQYVAQANSWSLEELCLEVNVTTAQGAALDACSFGIKGWIKAARHPP